MQLARAKETPSIGTSIDFLAPRRAINAIDVEAIVREATMDGVARPQVHLNPCATSAGWTRVTCSAEMTLRLVNAWRETVGRTMLDGEEGEERLAAIRRAAIAAYRAFEDARGKPGATRRW